jgi:hypothetical protein
MGATWGPWNGSEQWVQTKKATYLDQVRLIHFVGLLFLFIDTLRQLLSHICINRHVNTRCALCFLQLLDGDVTTGECCEVSEIMLDRLPFS